MKFYGTSIPTSVPVSSSTPCGHVWEGQKCNLAVGVGTDLSRCVCCDCRYATCSTNDDQLAVEGTDRRLCVDMWAPALTLHVSTGPVFAGHDVVQSGKRTKDSMNLTTIIYPENVGKNRPEN